MFLYFRETGKAHIKKTKHKDTISKATTEKLKNTRQRFIFGNNR